MIEARATFSAFLVAAAGIVAGGRFDPEVQQGTAAGPYLIGRGPCVAIEEGRAVNPGTHLVAIVPGKDPANVTVEELRPWTGRAAGGPRRPATDCMHWFEEEVTDGSGNRIRLTPVKSLARVSIASDDWETFFALELQPVRLIIAGAPRVVGASERRRLFETVRPTLPASWTPARTLLRAQRYGPTGGHEVIELWVGWPTRNPQGVTPSIKHVAIRRFFLVDGRVAASDDYERTSGVEEHADIEPPELTNDAWSVPQGETTVAFVSSDRGASWERLSTNVGFETTIWQVHSLREGMPLVFGRDLYTHH